MQMDTAMIEIPLLTAVLAAEAIVALLGVLILLIYRRSRKGRDDRDHATALVNRINHEDVAHEQRLANALSESAELLDETLRSATVEEVLRKEKALYRQAIQAFLSQDPLKLAEIDRHVRGLSEPYCRLIGRLLEQAPRREAAPDARVAKLEAELLRAQAEADSAKEQLSAAMEALDDVSNEYARMFGSARTAKELRDSLDRVFAVFRRVLQSAEAQFPPESPTGGAASGRDQP